MISKQTKIVDHINIIFDQNFIRSLSLLSKRKIDPITIDVGNENMIVGITCPVVMNEDTFEQDKKSIESDILKAFALILNSEICNRKQEETISTQANRRLVKYTSFPCPHCGSTDTIGYGYRKTNVGIKAKRQCKNCYICYTNQEDKLWKMKNRQDVIEESLKLRKDSSLRNTARLINEKFGVKVSYATISNWCRNKKSCKS